MILIPQPGIFLQELQMLLCLDQSYWKRDDDSDENYDYNQYYDDNESSSLSSFQL